MAIKPWKTISSKVVFDQKWMPILQESVELPNTIIIDDYYLWKEGDVAMGIPVLPDGKIVLVRQYRHGSKQVSLEVPAGMVDSHENMVEALKREVLEETGYKVVKEEKLSMTTPSPGKIRGMTHVYVVYVASERQQSHQDITEELEIVLVSVHDIPELILNGSIIDAPSIAALYLYDLKMKFNA